MENTKLSKEKLYETSIKEGYTAIAIRNLTEFLRWLLNTSPELHIGKPLGNIRLSWDI